MNLCFPVEFLKCEVSLYWWKPKANKKPAPFTRRSGRVAERRVPASAVLARPRHPAAPQTGSFPPRDQRRYPQGPIRRAQGLHHGVLGAWDSVRPTRVPWGSLGCARASQPGRGAGPGGAVSPRTAPHSCGGQWSRPAFRRACHGQRVPGTPFTTRASWDLGLKGSGQLPWPCMVQMLTRERSRGGPEWRGRDPAG